MKGITIKYVCKRFFSALFTLWVALTFNFLLPRMMGGDPAEFLASQSALGSAEYAQQVREQFGLDKGIFEQYIRYLGGLLQGDLGVSYTNFPIPVTQIITQAIPWTLLVVLVSTLLSFLIAWVIGTLAALKKGSCSTMWPWALPSISSPSPISGWACCW